MRLKNILYFFWWYCKDIYLLLLPIAVLFLFLTWINPSKYYFSYMLISLMLLMICGPFFGSLLYYNQKIQNNLEELKALLSREQTISYLQSLEIELSGLFSSATVIPVLIIALITMIGGTTTHISLADVAEQLIFIYSLLLCIRAFIRYKNNGMHDGHFIRVD